MPASPEEPRRYGTLEAVAGMSAFVAAYDGYILDQWGVLHDGTYPYAGAVECLQRLRAAGKRIVVLSNSSRRETENLALMERMGFDTRLIDRFVSAGEDAHCALQTRTQAFHRRLGQRCYAFTRGGDHSHFDDIGLEFVDRVEDADFLAVIGSDSPQRTLADYEGELQSAFGRRLPMICANPDTARFAPSGLIEAPGVLARRYEELGGDVYYHGKPYPGIYTACLEALGCDPRKIIAIGDSVEHDVLGASRVGLTSALIPGGVHGPELGVTWGGLPTPEAWSAFSASAPAQPGYLLAAFRW